jgi:hypothetical protein
LGSDYQWAWRLSARSLKLPFMNGDPNLVEATTRASLPMAGRRDAWLERRLGYLAGELARLKGGPPLRRFLRGAVAAYRRFVHTGEPAYRFHCWATIRTVSAGLDQLERGEVGHEGSGSALDLLDHERSLARGLTDRVL